MHSISVFCGSSAGTDDIFQASAYQLGKYFANHGIQLVYGGANVGLMGAVANGVIENGGKVIGVLPLFLRNVEIAHKNLTQLIIVESMHERKTKMNELSDGVIMLPGGFGTLEEFFEMLTWAQLGLHKKPLAILNINGFYDELLSLIQKMVRKGFLKQANQDMIMVGDNIATLIDKMKNYKAPAEGKWIDKSQNSLIENIALPTAGLIIIKDNKLLLAYSKHKMAWYLPGGKVDIGESPRSALQREIKEELNIVLNPKLLLYYCHITAPAYGENPNIIMEQDCFLYKLDEDIQPSNEISAVKYFDYQSYKSEPVQVIGVLQLFDTLYEDKILTNSDD